MDYRIEKKPAMTFRGIKKEVTTVDGQNHEILPKFWEDFFTMPVLKSILAHIGPLPKSIQDVWKRIVQEFFPGTTYEHANLPELEIFYDGDTESEEYRCEVWIPILEK